MLHTRRGKKEIRRHQECCAGMAGPAGWAVAVAVAAAAAVAHAGHFATKPASEKGLPRRSTPTPTGSLEDEAHPTRNLQRPVASWPPVRRHEGNPRWFEFRGRAVALVSDGEHYGGLINAAFDYETYFATIAARNLTLTEAFVGTYVEPDSDCDPTGKFPLDNPLSPLNGSFLSPWARSAVPGGPKGGPKFDLTAWDPAYFARLTAFVASAGRHGVVVQLGLFCGYDATHEFIWGMNPMNPRNNVNGFAANRSTAYTLNADPQLVAAQLALVRQVVAAVRGADNVVVSLAFTTNGTEPAWAARIAAEVRSVDPTKMVVVPVQWLDALGPVLGDNVVASCGAESDCQGGAGGYARPATGAHPSTLDSRGPSDAVLAAAGGDAIVAYRRTYWGWAMSGGAAVYNLDWSFTVGHENGTATYPQAKSTNSGPAYRELLGTLSTFMGALPLAELRPSVAWFSVTPGGLDNSSEGANHHDAFGLGGVRDFAAYVVGPTSGVVLQLKIAGGGECDVTFVHPQTGGPVARHSRVSPTACVPLPEGQTDAAARVRCNPH